MLSTQMRLRVEFICSRIAQNATVELSDMSWIQKLAQRNPTVDNKLRSARSIAINGTPSPDSMDGFCLDLGITEPDPSDHLVGPQDPVTLAEWFSTKRRWFRGQAD